MKKYDNIIVITPHFSYGDSYSMVGLLYYLLEYYEKVFYFVGDGVLVEYYTRFFSSDPLFNKHIFTTTQPELLINGGEYGEYHICSLLTYNWLVPATPYMELENINQKYYFNDLNPITNILDTQNDHSTQPNTHYPNKVLEINHIFYYKLIGLSNVVRMDYFSYTRDLDIELTYKTTILKNHDIEPNDKYNIINDPGGGGGKLIDYIDNGFPIINLNYLAPSPGYLLTLVEGAETVHLVEGTNSLFLYQCYYKNIINYSGKTYFHVWARQRQWSNKNMNLDFSWKMYTEPMLDNWVYLFDQP